MAMPRIAQPMIPIRGGPPRATAGPGTAASAIGISVEGGHE